MRISKGLLFLMLALAAIGVAACSTQGDDLSGAAVGDTGVENPVPPVEPTPPPPAVAPQPGAAIPGGQTDPMNPPPGGAGAVVPPASGFPTGPFNDLETFLAQLPPKQKLEWQDLIVACGPNPACLDELKKFEAYLTDLCPQQPGCADAVARMIYLSRSKAQRERGTYTSNYPEAQVVVASLMKANESDAGVIPEPPAEDTGTALGAIVLLLRERPGTVDLPDIMGLIEENDPVSGVIVSDKLQTVVDGATAETFTSFATINALRGGEKVVTTEAAAALEEMTSAVSTAVVAPGGSAAAQPPAPPSPLKIAMQNLIVKWQEPGVPQMITLAVLKDLLKQNGAAEPMTLEFETALKAIAVGNLVFPTADLLIKNQAVPKAEVLMLLTELTK